ncbi:MAG: BlaI/MecI/CopY family transcriptional regulator [Pirellulales bacterium]|nr:BlaI/MecI/CopY family transcriptional regulator [Pirellulales bacterium]
MAPPPDAALTAVQFEIMQAVWSAPEGATVAEIWEAITRQREVARTTVLNLVGRLEKRGWLKRRKCEGVYRYVATVERAAATTLLTERFVDDFFGGSAAELVLNLLGSQQIKPAEIDHLRRLLTDADRSKKPQGRN